MSLKLRTFKFEPFSQKQIHLLTWWMPESRYRDKEGLIADGAIRSGKTVSMSLSFVIWSMATFSGQNFLICGKTVGSCRRNVVKPLKQMLISRGYWVRDRRSENILTISRGSVSNDYYIFGGKDEASQDLVQGLTAAGAFFDEVALMPESFVNQATARCSVDGSKWWFNCNPAGPSHWFKTNWIDKKDERELLYQHFTLEDNLSLSEKIKNRLRGQYTGVFYDRYILGKWALAEGLIYPRYDMAVEYAPEEARTAGFADYCISIDYGTQNAFAAILWGKWKNTWYGLKEYYWSGRDKGIQKTDDEYGTDLDEFIRPVMEEREARYKAEVKDLNPYAEMRKMETIIDPSAASFIALLKKKPWYKVRKANNDVLDGIRETSSAMYEGLIKISPDMKNWKDEVEGYVWDTKSGEDKPLKEKDHLMDSMRYFVKTKHLVRKKRNADISGFTDNYTDG